MNPIVYCAPPTDTSILARKAGILLSKVKPGSIKVECDICGIPVWIGPNIRESLITDPGTIVCFLCTIELRPDPDAIIPLGPTGNEYQNPENN